MIASDVSFFYFVVCVYVCVLTMPQNFKTTALFCCSFAIFLDMGLLLFLGTDRMYYVFVYSLIEFHLLFRSKWLTIRVVYEQIFGEKYGDLCLPGLKYGVWF